jgi:hypothetical protein
LFYLQTHKWEVGASLGIGAEPELKISKNFILPQFLGLGNAFERNYIQGFFFIV